MNPLDQTYLIFRNLKWIIAISLVISGVLLLPNQVIELYRISATEQGTVALWQFVSIALVALVIWLGALQVTVETLTSLPRLDTVPAYIARCLPFTLGSLPLFAAGWAQFSSIPLVQNVPQKLVEVGSVFRVQYFNLLGIAEVLKFHGLVFLAMALLLAAGMSLIHSRVLAFSGKANSAYFGNGQFLVATIALVVAVTVAFIQSPVFFSQKLGAFGILAIFTFCLTAIVIHLSLITIKRRVPFIPVILAFILVISARDLNDNHFIRLLPARSPDAVNPAPARMSAKDAFAAWLRQRAPAINSANRYPVFIVTAQGGGVYAAYNAAVFLARMQDLCPTFHHHVFAISAVSGGSVGAATFAAALDAAGEIGPQPGVSASDPCPRISRFLSNAHALDDLDKVGEAEGNIDLTLNADYLSPLLASTLFPNFVQSIIPYPLGFLDRARALEYALEQSAENMYKKKKTASGVDVKVDIASTSEERNLLKRRFQDHWSPTGPIPALLLNATDSGTGKRVVISPFNLEKADSTLSDVCVLPSQKASAQFSLSTAAFISARFPWVTPAATTDLSNPCIRARTIAAETAEQQTTEKIRLVDGGYIDNSGIDTALDLISEIRQVTPGPDPGNAASTVAAQLPPFQIYLVSLSSGDFPNRREYTFNELLEPIRALLNGREARASIAQNRASAEFHAIPGTKELPRFNRTGLQSYYYDLPLGWAMSVKTREIIALDSGRFWDCEPDKDFSQSDKSLSNADCVQLQIYHLLNNSAESALEGLEAAIKTVKEVSERTTSAGQASQRLDHEQLLVCYEQDWQRKKKLQWQGRQDAFARAHEAWMKRLPSDADKLEPVAPPPFKQSYLSHYQAEHARELLSEWDRLTNLKDPAVLAYILGSISYDSDDFRRTSDNLTYKTVAQMTRAWRARIERVNQDRQNEAPPKNEVDLSKLTNNPRDFAEIVWGWNGNWFGNNRAANGKWDPMLKEGWKYKSRGIYQIVGREQYNDASNWLKHGNPGLAGMLPIDRPDVVLNRTISAKIAFSHFSNWKKGPLRKTLLEVLAASPGDFSLARRNQSDMGDGNDASEVAQRSAMFLQCIVKAKPVLGPAAAGNSALAH